MRVVFSFSVKQHLMISRRLRVRATLVSYHFLTNMSRRQQPEILRFVKLTGRRFLRKRVRAGTALSR
jgi:hypothetical protein